MPSARFLLVGDGPTRREVEAHAASLGLGDRVIFTGIRDDVPELLRGIDVFVLSSYTVECFPMALLEAMAAGRPGGVYGGRRCSRDDRGRRHRLPGPAARRPRACRQAPGLLGDPDSARAMGSAARQRVEEEFSLQRSVAGAERAIEEVAAAAGVSTTVRRDRPVELAVILDVVHVGGVEVLYRNLFTHFDPTVVHPRLLCLREAGLAADEFRAAGFSVEVVPRSWSQGDRASSAARGRPASTSCRCRARFHITSVRHCCSGLSRPSWRASP